MENDMEITRKDEEPCSTHISVELAYK